MNILSAKRQPFCLGLNAFNVTPRCGQCVGGTTGLSFDYLMDACDVCGGDGTSCLDCAGAAFGTNEIDLCGICRDPDGAEWNTGEFLSFISEKQLLLQNFCDCWISIYHTSPTVFRLLNTLRPRQNGRRFLDDTFKRIFLDENVRISIKIPLKFVHKGPINKISALVQIMAWRRPGDKPLSEPMMVRLLTHICVIRPQWLGVIPSCRGRATHTCQ